VFFRTVFSLGTLFSLGLRGEIQSGPRPYPLTKAVSDGPISQIIFQRFSPKNRMSSPKTTQLYENKGNRVGMFPLSNPLYFKQWRN
jgi:hypothetical protein